VPISEINTFDPQAGDVWHDVVPSFTGGQHWHARTDAAGEVELFELNGPGLVPAHAVGKMQGGLTLVSRGIRTLPDASGLWPCRRMAGAVTRERDRGWPGFGPGWSWLCSDIVRDRPSPATRPKPTGGAL
jgi:hypothetical protein